MVHVRLDNLTYKQSIELAKQNKITLTDYLRHIITLCNDRVRRGEFLWTDQK